MCRELREVLGSPLSGVQGLVGQNRQGCSSVVSNRSRGGTRSGVVSAVHGGFQEAEDPQTAEFLWGTRGRARCLGRLPWGFV